MAAIVNDRDLLLSGVTPRYTPDSLGLVDANGNVIFAAGVGLDFNSRFGANTTNLPANDATVGAPAGTFVNGVAVAIVTTATTNFNGRNDRIATAVTAPTIVVDGTAVDHTSRDDGAVDVSFEWVWSGAEADIDGFRVYQYATTATTSYTFGTAPAFETVYEIPVNKRAFIFYGLAANQYFTFGVQAYRVVDKDVNASGVITSLIIKPSLAAENPYRPASAVAFAGNVTGTIGGVAVATLNQSVADAQSAADTAKTSADASALVLADIASDAKFTPSEKQLVLKEWQSIVGEKAGIETQATALGITTELTNYINALVALGTYMSGGVAWAFSTSVPPIWINATYFSTTTDIVGATFRTTWTNFYNNRQILMNRAVELAATLSAWSGVSGAGKPADYATVGAPAGTLVNGVAVATITSAVSNFNASNDRVATAVVAPTILGDGTAMDHTIQTNGSADISFEWGWSGAEGDIDGFQVFVRQSSSSVAYTFGSTPVEETVYEIPAAKRTFILFGVVPNQYYTFGVRAYRGVDKDINAAGIILSTLVKPVLAAENPYQPSSSVAFAGNVTGTVNGIAANAVNVWASISGTGKPANNADVTSTHTSAGFTGQGSLATLNTVATAVMDPKSATHFEMVILSVPDSTTVTYDFYMDHDGQIAVLCTVGFNSSSASGTYTCILEIDAENYFLTLNGSYSYGGPPQLALEIPKWIITGWHTVKVYARKSGATSAHNASTTILKSYR